jgi:hypothetical protein
MEDTSKTIQELYADKDLTIKKEQLAVLLNAEPPSSWVKTHPYVKNWRYLPIDKIEFLLRKFFKTYKVEVLKYGEIFNAVHCSVRVHYLDPVMNEMTFQDGVASADLQLRKGTKELSKGATQMALPIAKTLAIKDACELIGNVFGGNLNRKDTIGYEFDEKLSEPKLDNIV